MKRPTSLIGVLFLLLSTIFIPFLGGQAEVGTINTVETSPIDYEKAWDIFETLISYSGCSAEIEYRDGGRQRKSTLIISSARTTEETIKIFYSSKLKVIDRGDTWIIFEYGDWIFTYDYSDALQVKDLTAEVVSNQLEMSVPAKIGERVEIDPVVSVFDIPDVALESAGYPFQRQAFYHNGLFWVFAGDLFIGGAGNKLGYFTSPGGISWTGPIAIGAETCRYTSDMDIHYDGTYIHIIWMTNNQPNLKLYYRRGTLNADGSITWTARQIVRQNLANVAYRNFGVGVNTTGYPYVSYLNDTNTNDLPHVIISDNNDGTWSGAEVPFQLNAISTYYWATCVISLTKGRMFVFYGRRNGRIYGRFWTPGIGWGGEITVSSDDFEYHWDWGATSDWDDDIFLVYCRDINWQIRYRRYNNATGLWEVERTLYDHYYEVRPTITVIHPKLVNSKTRDLYVFWADDIIDKLIFITGPKSGTLWTGPAVWRDENSIEDSRFCSFDRQYGDYVGVTYSSYMGPGPTRSLNMAWFANYTIYQDLTVNTTIEDEWATCRGNFTNGNYESYWLSHNATGAWQNETRMWFPYHLPPYYPTMPVTDQSQYSFHINARAGQVVGWRFYYYDLFNGELSTLIQTFTVESAGQPSIVGLALAICSPFVILAIVLARRR